MDHLSNRRKKRYVTKKDARQKHERIRVFVNGVLACSAWISFGIIAYNEDTILFKNDKAALLFDAYTLRILEGTVIIII